jgi:hypothetical protein
MAAVQRAAPGAAGYVYEKVAIGLRQNHRNVNPAMAPVYYPWYDDNSGLKRTHRELGDSRAERSAVSVRSPPAILRRARPVKAGGFGINTVRRGSLMAIRGTIVD